MKSCSQIFLYSIFLVFLALIPLSAAEYNFSPDKISAEELLVFGQDRIGLHSFRHEFAAALSEMEHRIDSNTSAYLIANQQQVNRLRQVYDLYALRWKLEEQLYSFQRNPQAMVVTVNQLYPDPSLLQKSTDGDQLQRMADDNLYTALHLLALFAAYDISLGDFDQAIQTMLLYRELPGLSSELTEQMPADDQIRPYLNKFKSLLYSLEQEIQRYDFRRQRLPVPEIFGAVVGFGISGAALADLLIPAVTLPFFPGDSSARSAALAGTALSGTIIGISAITIPPLVRTPPVQPLTEYLAEEWGHLIEGAIQVFEDYRHRQGQLIVLSLMPNRLVVFPDASGPKELPAVFNVQRSGNFRIQVSRGHERISTPVRELHQGLNLILLYE
ncbi:hypothetical protein [Spirochaeta dissipatitropha]